MIQADEYPLWYFSYRPVPLRKAVALTLGPESYGANPPFTRTYLLAKKDAQVALYKSLEGEEVEVTDYTLPTSAVSSAYQGRFALALTPTQAVVAVQTGAAGGIRGEPATIEVYVGNSKVYTTSGYDPQLVYSAIMLDDLVSSSPECAVKLGAVILFYISTNGDKLVAEYLRPPYDAPSLRTEFPLDQALQLIAAIPAKGLAQLWFVNAQGEWVAAQFSARVLQPRLSGEVPGPEIWNNPQSGEYQVVFGHTWTWRVDKQNNRFVLRKKAGGPEYYVPADHSLQDVCFADVAFDHAGYPAVAYQIGASTYVKYWDILRRAYVTTEALPLSFPLMLQEATILAWRNPPQADVMVFGQNRSGSLVARRQKDNYGIEYVLLSNLQFIPTAIDLSKGLRYDVTGFETSTRYRSPLYPYDTYSYRRANLPTPEYPIDHNFFVKLVNASITTRELVHQYIPSNIVISTQLLAGNVSTRELVKQYATAIALAVSLQAANVALREVVRVYLPPEIKLATQLLNAAISTREVVAPYNLPEIGMRVQLVSANVQMR
jgi:Trp operon repressor